MNTKEGISSQLESDIVYNQKVELDYIEKSLLTALKKSNTYTSDHPLITYIDAFSKYIGSAQKYTVILAERIGFDYSLSRYIYAKNIDLREVIYYEFLNYILSAEPNLKSVELPTTAKLIAMNDIKEFEPIFEKFDLGNGRKIEKSDFRKRLSLITDYFMRKKD